MGSEILLRCLLDDGTDCVGVDDDDDDADAEADVIPEFRFAFESVFLLSADKLSAVHRFLSVIFLLKQEKQVKEKIPYGNQFSMNMKTAFEFWSI